MFTKVLIANRGAIACRIIRTLKKMGVASVAVYAAADAHSLHVRQADEAISLGDGAASATYLDAEKILQAAIESGAQAIHPGYGFLSENADFAQRCEDSGIAFIGPTPQNMREFGRKHTARAVAIRENVPILPGSELLRDVEHAVAEAQRIGFPVMLKSTSGGGGIGMRLANDETALREAYESVRRLAQSNFNDASLYLERFVTRARHIEVQIFGDGNGEVVSLGERDCSVQRRNQKVIEETPAPRFSDAQRARLDEAALRLCRAVSYRNAGTVEFVLDDESGEFYFLEVNTRLQVEHGVTEEVTGVDLVEWMIRLAAGERVLEDRVLETPTRRGHSMQVRVYAEDAAKNFQPSVGLLTQVAFSPNARVETWIESGTEVSPFYDPMLAKLIVHADNREAAAVALQKALSETQIAGIETNLEYLRQIISDETFQNGEQTTSYLSRFEYSMNGVDVLQSGVQTTVQDWPARLGYWNVGVPPSGPMDALSLRLANVLVGNEEGAPALECAMIGPTLRFRHDATIAIAGADMNATLDGATLETGRSHRVKKGSKLQMGAIRGGGARAYVAVAGGFDVPEYLGSRATFTMGNFGGHGGRALRVGDVLPISKTEDRVLDVDKTDVEKVAPPSLTPTFSNAWEIAVLYGPHGAPDFFTDDDIEMFFATDWEVHYNSNRTGVRLIGPKPTWARQDGGEAGLHPSNIHDNAYAIGSVDFTGDMPVILGPDGPSLGGFVCPVVVVEAELWKVGQLRPGDRVRFVSVDAERAHSLRQTQDAQLKMMQALTPLSLRSSSPLPSLGEGLGVRALTLGNASPILYRREKDDINPQVVYRRAGDDNILVEYGPVVLDMDLRFRVHALMTWLQHHDINGIIDLTPGIRSLQVHFDNRVLPRDELIAIFQQAENELPATDDMEVPTRIVHLPLSWNDPTVQLAIEKYGQSVRQDAPWCPSNIEFIRRINGLNSIEAVRQTVFDASYLVLGLGDVYLGAPVATPLDPRHRLVTTKYNPARTWTPENAVGIGGAYMCIYGLEGPGGYQLVGRTLPIWNTYRATRDFEKPWLLRFFDQVRYYPVEADELHAMRDDFRAGRFQLKVEHETFKLRDYHAFLRDNTASIDAFKATQKIAFETEREQWRLNGQADYVSEDLSAPPVAEDELPEGALSIDAPTAGAVWKINVAAGDEIEQDDVILIIEIMKMEFPIVAPCHCQILDVLCAEGQMVTSGQRLAVVQPLDWKRASAPLT